MPSLEQLSYTRDIVYKCTLAWGSSLKMWNMSLKPVTSSRTPAWCLPAYRAILYTSTQKKSNCFLQGLLTGKQLFLGVNLMDHNEAYFWVKVLKIRHKTTFPKPPGFPLPWSLSQYTVVPKLWAVPPQSAVETSQAATEPLQKTHHLAQCIGL